MSSEVRACTKALLIRRQCRLLQKWRIGSLLVDDGSRYLGIITDTGSEPEGRRQGVGSNSTTVMSCMSKAVVTIEDSEPIKEALRLMKKKASGICR